MDQGAVAGRVGGERRGRSTPPARTSRGGIGALRGSAARSSVQPRDVRRERAQLRERRHVQPCVRAPRRSRTPPGPTARSGPPGAAARAAAPSGAGRPAGAATAPAPAQRLSARCSCSASGCGVTTFSAAGRPLAVRTGATSAVAAPHRGCRRRVSCQSSSSSSRTCLQAQGDSIQWSGGSSGRSGTGRCSSVQPSPNASCATPRQNRPAPALSCWNAIVHGPG